GGPPTPLTPKRRRPTNTPNLLTKTLCPPACPKSRRAPNRQNVTKAIPHSDADRRSSRRCFPCACRMGTWDDKPHAMTAAPVDNIRNFSIVAHIDHGKSTLPDRLVQLTGGASERQGVGAGLASLGHERARGID